MTKYTIVADVSIHQQESPIGINDYKAINALMNGHGAFIEVEGSDALVYIPYEAVTLMTIHRSTEEVEAPEDPLCQPVTCETTEPCDPPDDDNEDDPPDDDNGGDETP